MRGHRTQGVAVGVLLGIGLVACGEGQPEPEPDGTEADCFDGWCRFGRSKAPTTGDTTVHSSAWWRMRAA